MIYEWNFWNRVAVLAGGHMLQWLSLFCSRGDRLLLMCLRRSIAEQQPTNSAADEVECSDHEDNRSHGVIQTDAGPVKTAASSPSCLRCAHFHCADGPTSHLILCIVMYMPDDPFFKLGLTPSSFDAKSRSLIGRNFSLTHIIILLQYQF